MAVSWPLVKHGTYDAGDVATASNFENDFNKVFDAVNQLHNRFSSFQISTTYSRVKESSQIFVSKQAGTHRQLVHAFKVPDWMQGLRIRRFSVGNMSALSVTSGFADHSSESLKFRVATGASMSAFNVASYSGTDVATADFTLASGSQDPIIGLDASGGYPTVIEGDVTSSNVVLPDTYIAVYFIGGVNRSAGVWTGDMLFDINILCDAMVPVP